MNTQNKLVTIIVLIMLVLNPIHGYAFFSSDGPDGFEGEGDFVEGPAGAGAIILAIPGMVVGTVVGIPLMPIDRTSPLWLGFGGAFVGINIGYYMAGTPFFVAKKILCDGPKKLFSRQSEVKEKEQKNEKI